MLLKDYVLYWYKTYKEPVQEPNTAAVNLCYLHVHLFPSPLGQKDLSAIHTHDIQEFLADLLLQGNRCPIKSIATYGKPLSRWTVSRIRQLLIAALNSAVKEGLVSYNCAADTTSIPLPASTVTPFTAEEQHIFLSHTRNHRFYLIYLLYFYTGCRRGEILGLSWASVQWSKDCILITQTLIMENGIPVLKHKHAKTAKSIRAIPIPKDIKIRLHEWKRQQQREKTQYKDWHNPDDLVFTQKNGKAVNPATFSASFKRKAIKLGLSPHLHLNCTRHSWTTNMVQMNIPISDIQALGGWSRPDILLQIYAQTVQKSQKKAINRLYKEYPPV